MNMTFLRVLKCIASLFILVVVSLFVFDGRS